MDKALELEERNQAWREGGMAGFLKGGGNSRSIQPYQAPVSTRMVGGSTSAAYGERGGRGQVEGFGLWGIEESGDTRALTGGLARMLAARSLFQM